jgi:spore germination protein KB
MYLLISISPIARQIPNKVAMIGGSSGYISCFISAFVILLLALILLQIIKKYSSLNIYKLIDNICGTLLGKVIIFFYLIWAIISCIIKISSYSLMMQTTLIPTMKNWFLILVMLLLVVYALSKGTKTILRFAEFSFLPIIFFLLGLVIFAIPLVDLKNLHSKSGLNIASNIAASKYVYTIGGNLILILFLGNRLSNEVTYATIKKNILRCIGVFSLMALVSCVVTIGVNGYRLTGQLTYPLFTTIKSVSILNFMERFEAFITLSCFFSDFIIICIFITIIIDSLKWIIGSDKMNIITTILVILGISIVTFLNITQFELAYLYSNVMIFLNIIFQYVIPFLLALLLFFRKGLES